MNNHIQLNESVFLLNDLAKANLFLNFIILNGLKPNPIHEFPPFLNG